MPTLQASSENAHAIYLIARIRDIGHRIRNNQPLPYGPGMLPLSDARYYAAGLGMMETLASAAADEVERLLREQEASA